MKEEKIIELLEGFFLDEKMNDCFVVDLNISGNKIAVFVDSDDVLGFDKCRKISRFLESHFDESKAFGEKYTLEVSSPGIGKPLKFKRQYIKNIGRKVEVSLVGEERKLKGQLKEVNDDGVVLEYEVTKKEGKKKKKEIVQKEIKDIEIEKIIVKVSF